MRKIMLFAIISILLISCQGGTINNEEKSEYSIGDVGPGGGIIFYDCDADNVGITGSGDDNLSSLVAGWQYLEAAPYDVRAYTDPKTNSTVTGISDLELPAEYHFGYSRNSVDGSNLYVNGSTEYSFSNCTRLEIGSGLKNTNDIVSSYGSSAYTFESGSNTTNLYAANVCKNLEYGGKDDWFLPSRDELKELYNQRDLFDSYKEFPYAYAFRQEDYGYCSSSEGYTANETGEGLYAFYVEFETGLELSNSKSTNRFIRPIRRF